MTRHVDVPQHLRAWLEAPLLLVTVGEESLEDYRSSGFRYMKVKGSRGLIFVALMKMLNFNIDSPWDERGINHQFSHSTSHPFVKPFPLASGNLFVSLHWLPMSWPFLLISCESRGYSKTLTLKEFMQCYIFSMGCTTVSERLEHKTYCMMYEAPLTFRWSDLALNPCWGRIGSVEGLVEPRFGEPQFQAWSFVFFLTSLMVDWIHVTWLTCRILKTNINQHSILLLFDWR